LYNNEKSRLDAKVQERTASVWSYFLSRREEFTNKDYDGGKIDDHIKGQERLIFPKLDKVRWWHEVFNKSDQDMNGSTNAVTERYLGQYDGIAGRRSVLTGVETAKTAVGTEPSKQVPANGNAAIATGALANLREGIAGFGIGSLRGGSGTKSPAGKAVVKQEMEVEMQ